MEMKSYTCTFTVKNKPEEVFDAICHVSDWWTRNISGSAKKVNDLFTVDFGETFVKFKVLEIIPYKKIVWKVTDCYLHFINDKTEWNDTQVDFEISTTKGGTQMSMTHVGLVPGIECYDTCENGWNFYAGDSLLKLVTQKKGLPDARKSPESAT
jgi:hypothetical protein